jgi:hypothetical protein
LENERKKVKICRRGEIKAIRSIRSQHGLNYFQMGQKNISVGEETTASWF